MGALSFGKKNQNPIINDALEESNNRLKELRKKYNRLLAEDAPHHRRQVDLEQALRATSTEEEKKNIKNQLAEIHKLRSGIDPNKFYREHIESEANNVTHLVYQQNLELENKIRKNLTSIKSKMVNYIQHVKKRFHQYYTENKINDEMFPKNGNLNQLDQLLKYLQRLLKKDSKIVIELRKYIILKQLDELLSNNLLPPSELIQTFNNALANKEFYKIKCPTLYSTFSQTTAPECELTKSDSIKIKLAFLGIGLSKGEIMLKDIKQLRESATKIAAQVNKHNKRKTQIIYDS